MAGWKRRAAENNLENAAWDYWEAYQEMVEEKIQTWRDGYLFLDEERVNSNVKRTGRNWVEFRAEGYFVPENNDVLHVYMVLICDIDPGTTDPCRVWGYFASTSRKMSEFGHHLYAPLKGLQERVHKKYR